MQMKAAGFIGLGQMGSGMARNLLQSVDTLFVYDQRAEAMQKLEQIGAVACSSPAEVAKRCDLVFLCLPYAPEVRFAIFDPTGIQAGSRHGERKPTRIIDTTTLDRSDAISIGADAANASIIYWDCPVSGLPSRAQDGTLTLMFGGNRDGFEQYGDQLTSFGEALYCGELGSGQAMKAINNIIYNINIAALCEVLPLAVAVGLDPEQLAGVVTSGSSRSFASEHFVSRMLAGRFDNDFALKDAYKDVINVQKMGIETQALLPVVNAMVASYQSAMAAGFGHEPKSAMLKVYENVLGVQFRKSPIL